MSKIQLYCRCEHCKEYFEIGGIASKIRLYCKRSCRDAAYYLRKVGNNMESEKIIYVQKAITGMVISL